MEVSTMKFLKAVLPVAVAGLLAAQTQPPAKPIDEEGEIATFRSQNITIVAPVLVTDRSGKIIDGLQPNQFHLYDNGKEQNINVDVTFEPISLVIAMECSARVESVLKQMKHLGSLTQEIIGTQGEAAVVKFDGRITTMQDFTSDPDKIKVAIDKINAGSSGTRMIDAVEASVRMLDHRPKNNRKIILLVSETRDEGSEARVRATSVYANFHNVTIYCVDITQLAVRFTERQPDPGPVPAMDPTTMNNPMGQPNTPTTMSQNYGMGNRAQFVPLLKEIYTDAKGIFVKDPAKQFSLQTGGQHFYFVKQKGMEDAVARIGEEIHSQYLVSYRPSNFGESGYHTIEVTIDRSPQYITKTRPGYWNGGGRQQ
jgi:VWFA-related protein